jgi:hypothetical protein
MRQVASDIGERIGKSPDNPQKPAIGDAE